MCKAFSGVVHKSGKVYWKFAMDSHEDIKDKFKLDDSEKGKICPIEITPNNSDYHFPDKWTLIFDEGNAPAWWKASHEKHAWEAHKSWLRKLNKILKKKKVVHPSEIEPPKRFLRNILSY